MDARKSVQFSLEESMPPSEASSRSQSPAPFETLHQPLPSQSTMQDLIDKKSSVLDFEETPGLRGDDVYDSTLVWWRAAIRRKLVATVRVESKIIARMQDKIRTPWLDAYFVYTSSLGTHTFFMILLPIFFFFGYGELGRGRLITVLASGVYSASFVKDLLCSPRPFAPPVTRLTIGSHHLEYGFPSTHSTNSVSIALFFFAIANGLASTAEPVISSWLYNVLCGILLFYTFSIVFGRLYTAMHSFTDCFFGVLLGGSIWWAHTDWPGISFVLSSSHILHQTLSSLGLGSIDPSGSLVLQIGAGLRAGKWLEGWVQHGGWEVPLILIPLCLLAVHKHPQPVDDCPCFEDAIAFASVVLGALLSQWVMHYSGAIQHARAVIMPGSGWILEAGKWIRVERGLEDILLWWGVAILKMVVGVLTIFAWRIFAKSALHIILPPTFRLLAKFFSLPRRRFYTPATEYKSVPSEFHSEATGGFGLRPIPSVIDLPSTGMVGVETGGIGSGVEGVSNLHFHGNGHGTNGYGFANGNGNGSLLKLRNGSGNGSVDVLVSSKEINNVAEYVKEKRGKDVDGESVKHYDADVLTKVIVYAGIAILASDGLPLLFNLLGWGVKSWVEV